MSYLQNELNIKSNWLIWVADMMVGDKKIADPVDRSKIQVALSNGIHKKKLGRFKVYLNKENRTELIVERLK